MRGVIIGGGPGRRRHQCAIADQFFHPNAPIDANAQLGRLRALAQQGDLVQGQRFGRFAIRMGRDHHQRVNHRFLGGT